MKANGKPVEILIKLNELAGFPSDVETELFEVNCVIFKGFSTIFFFFAWAQSLEFSSSHHLIHPF